VRHSALDPGPVPCRWHAWLCCAYWSSPSSSSTSLSLHTSGWYHGWADPVWYEPLMVGELLSLPAASSLLVEALKWSCVASALAAMTGRAPRLLGWTVAACWTWYQYVAFQLRQGRP
jgi:hypothetical protein